MEVELPEGTVLKVLLKKLNINRNRFIVIKDAEAVKEDYVLKDGDKITILPIVSGG
ncbi:MAG: thiamine biosynthesis protein ThiS [Thermoprotei archaeon]|nr:MAG: thiamine biosynthesis protein ThiS [Thermoprotei archaeon]